VRVLVAVLAAVLWAVVVLRVLQWHAIRKEARERPEAGLRTRVQPRRRLAGPRVRLLPEGHRPPPGLGPLSPSERFLTTEAARGLRELQLFLVDQRPA
jgi:hypothetical protein